MSNVTCHATIVNQKLKFLPQFATVQPADFWAQELQYLKNVGPKRAEVLQSVLGLRTFGDLLHYFPRDHTDRAALVAVQDIPAQGLVNQPVMLRGTLHKFQLRTLRNRKKMLTAHLHDGTGGIELVWFQGTPYIQKAYRTGDVVVVQGKPRLSARHTLQLVHPQLEKAAEATESAHQARILPVYPTSERLKHIGLDVKGFRALLWHLLTQGAKLLPETLPSGFRARHQLLDRPTALRAIHFPASWAELQAAQRRLKFEELFWFELVLAQRRHLQQPQRPAPVFARVGELFNRFYAEVLPFELTGAQKRVMKEVRADLRQPQQMNRLVQGDVGSGKTVVAALSILLALDNGYQAALMAPTEILAEQHFKTLYGWLSQVGVDVSLLKGAQKKSTRAAILTALANGQTSVVVGTHALLEPSVKFQRLGLTIIDEQHKFGVLQRAKLWQKHPGRYPHNLALTATPIPRTLAMTVYGDVDVSVIDELPPGRRAIITAVRKQVDRNRVFQFVQEELEKGRQAYFVYPLVEENEKLDLTAVTEGFAVLAERFGRFGVGMVHGQQRPEEKDHAMARFKAGETRVLVSTTVIEVGVDVPNATVMVIENATRFGLSQLHQLRGRVGRGEHQSYCILMAPDDLKGTALERLRTLAETTDGFRIAEADLRLRGPGDYLGTRQSGLPNFQLADILEDAALLREARGVAFALAQTDPALERPENAALRPGLNAFVESQQLQELMA